MEKTYCLRICGSFPSANHKKDWVRKSKRRKVSHFRKIRKFADLGFEEIIEGPNAFYARTYEDIIQSSRVSSAQRKA